MDTTLIVSLALLILLVISVGIVLCIKYLVSKKAEASKKEAAIKIATEEVEVKPNTDTNKEFNELLNQLKKLAN